MSDIDIVERLRALADTCVGDEDVPEILREAADVIEALRSLGKQTVGPSFADVTKGMRHEAPSHE